MVPLLGYLNELGGNVLLDILSKQEIYEVLVEFVDKNIDEIKSR